MLSAIARIIHEMNKGYYTYLLALLVILFALRPYDQGIIYLLIWKTLFTCAVLTAIFNCKHSKKVKTTAIFAAIPSLVFGWAELYYSSPTIFVIQVCFLLIVLWVCTTSILYDVILHAKVTKETLRGVVCAYFLIAFVFAYTYYLIEYLMPGSFHLLINDISFLTYSRTLAELMYFSFATLLTVGFGDITPIGDIAQTFVVLEGIIGQFYIAILVARIVSVYSLYGDKLLLKNAIKQMNAQKKE